MNKPIFLVSLFLISGFLLYFLMKGSGGVGSPFPPNTATQIPKVKVEGSSDSLQQKGEAVVDSGEANPPKDPSTQLKCPEGYTLKDEKYKKILTQEGLLHKANQRYYRFFDNKWEYTDSPYGKWKDASTGDKGVMLDNYFTKQIKTPPAPAPAPAPPPKPAIEKSKPLENKLNTLKRDAEKGNPQTKDALRNRYNTLRFKNGKNGEKINTEFDDLLKEIDIIITII